MLFTNHIASVGGTRIDLRRRRRRDGDKVHNPKYASIGSEPPDDRVQKLIEISACVVLFFLSGVLASGL